MRTRYVGPVHLPAEDYAILARLARDAERDPIQHARWLLRQALEQPDPEAPEWARQAGTGVVARRCRTCGSMSLIE